MFAYLIHQNNSRLIPPHFYYINISIIPSALGSQEHLHNALFWRMEYLIIAANRAVGCFRGDKPGTKHKYFEVHLKYSHEYRGINGTWQNPFIDFQFPS